MEVSTLQMLIAKFGAKGIGTYLWSPKWKRNLLEVPVRKRISSGKRLPQARD